MWPHRVLLEAVQPSDPLQGSPRLPSIDLVVPCHIKDIESLHLVIAGAVASAINPIGSVRLVAPSVTVDELASRFPDATISSDEEVLGESLLADVSRLVPRARRGWAIQQLVKFASGLASTARAVLIVDADTVLLRPRVWLDDSGVQALAASWEFHYPYARHTEAMWRGDGRSTRISFVTHHQLQQRDVLQRMFPEVTADLARWLSIAHWDEESAVSEYHSYGTWLSNAEPDRVRLAKWSNRIAQSSTLSGLPANADDALQVLRHRFRGAHSVSFHSYLG